MEVTDELKEAKWWARKFYADLSAEKLGRKYERQFFIDALVDMARFSEAQEELVAKWKSIVEYQMSGVDRLHYSFHQCIEAVNKQENEKVPRA